MTPERPGGALGAAQAAAGGGGAAPGSARPPMTVGGDAAPPFQVADFAARSAETLSAGPEIRVRPAAEAIALTHWAARAPEANRGAAARTDTVGNRAPALATATN